MLKKYTIQNLIAAVFLVLLLTNCTKDELAFDIIESPILAVFETIGSQSDVLTIKATFYDLDKSGILDKNIGIDSIPVGNLQVEVYINESILINSYQTDNQGIILFEESLDKLTGTSRLEWVGTYQDVPFRVYKNF